MINHIPKSFERTQFLSFMMINRSSGLLLFSVSIGILAMLSSLYATNPSFIHATQSKEENLFISLAIQVSTFLNWLLGYAGFSVFLATGFWAVMLMISGTLHRWRLKILSLVIFLLLAPLAIPEHTGLWGKIINKEVLRLIPTFSHSWLSLVALIMSLVFYLLAVAGNRRLIQGATLMGIGFTKFWNFLAKRRQDPAMVNEIFEDFQPDHDFENLALDNLPSIGSSKNSTFLDKKNAKEKPEVTRSKKRVSQPDLTLGAVPGALPTLSLLAEPSALDLDHNIP
ncbi:MAG TPA: hypothetical protein DIT98_02220, partial [Verrucomicrobiales bacterium]|nr:hypothetical protein [Verrucomicrobiales bacterium]